MNQSDPKFEIKKSKIQGKGLLASTRIKASEAVIVWHPKVLTKGEANNLPRNVQKQYTYPDGDKILWMQPPERYMNHSRKATTRVVGKSDVAAQDIRPGQEITSDYIDLETENFVCNCGTKNCRGVKS